MFLLLFRLRTLSARHLRTNSEKQLFLRAAGLLSMRTCVAFSPSLWAARPTFVTTSCRWGPLLRRLFHAPRPRARRRRGCPRAAPSHGVRQPRTIAPNWDERGRQRETCFSPMWPPASVGFSRKLFSACVDCSQQSVKGANLFCSGGRCFRNITVSRRSGTDEVEAVSFGGGDHVWDQKAGGARARPRTNSEMVSPIIFAREYEFFGLFCAKHTNAHG